MIVVTYLKRLTTEYVESEDRIRIAGELADAEPVVIWMTNRLASRAVPRILRWLDKETSPFAISSSGKGDVLQSFTQEAAVAGLKPQKRVTISASAPTWLTQTIDVAANKSHITLTFRGQQDQSATVRFDVTQFRQWLSILHLAWSKAQWSPLVWPDWIKRETSTQQQIVVH